MADERGTANENKTLAAPSPDVAKGSIRPVAVPPRPVTLPPRPNGSTSSLASRPTVTPPPLPAHVAPSTYTGPLPPPLPSRSSLEAAPTAPTSNTRPPPPSMRPAPPLDSNRVQELSAELISVQKALSEKNVELGKVISERNALRDRLVRAETSARELSSALAAEARLRAEVMETHVADNAALRSRVSELELLLESAKSAPVSIAAADLRRIRGIGPAYERALIALGIKGVAQLAQLSREDIVRIAPLIKAQPDRILRDDWIGQAQRLLSAQPDK